MHFSKRQASIRTRVGIETGFGKAEFVTFKNLDKGKEHFAICFNPWEGAASPLVRIHSECITGDLFKSYRCDCGEQLTEGISRFSQEGGILLYLRQEGRGIGLYNKLDAYILQEKGVDTFAANRQLGFDDDLRDFSIAAQMLKALGVKTIRLLTNNQQKVEEVRREGIVVGEVVQTGYFVHPENKRYLQAKAMIAKHKLKSELRA